MDGGWTRSVEGPRCKCMMLQGEGRGSVGQEVGVAASGVLKMTEMDGCSQYTNRAIGHVRLWAARVDVIRCNVEVLHSRWLSMMGSIALTTALCEALCGAIRWLEMTSNIGVY